MKTLSAYHQSGSLLNEGHKYISSYEQELHTHTHTSLRQMAFVCIQEMQTLNLLYFVNNLSDTDHYFARYLYMYFNTFWLNVLN